MKRVVLAFVLATACTAFFASSAAATPAPTGSRISIFQPEQTFPAGQPFYVQTGWGNNPGLDGGIGLWQFSLTVDGIAQMGFLNVSVSPDPGNPTGNLVLRPYLFNFPQGMTGTHVFAGTFSGPCPQMVSEGFATGPCTSPQEIVPLDSGPFTTTVTFTP
jgi:hypothetical protein